MLALQLTSNKETTDQTIDKNQSVESRLSKYLVIRFS